MPIALKGSSANTKMGNIARRRTRALCYLETFTSNDKEGKQNALYVNLDVNYFLNIEIEIQVMTFPPCL
jgi:hypothetical protein